MSLYRARWVLPIDRPPIEDGEVAVEEGRIADVRSRTRMSAGAIDLGEAAILPGLVNAHTHLEYTALRGFLEDVPFFPWIRTLTAVKAHLTAADWQASSHLGALECLAAGITTIADNTDAGSTLDAAARAGLRAQIYQEVFGIDPRQPVEPIMSGLKERIRALRAGAQASGSGERIEVGISPHAAYTVRPELFEALATWAGDENLPMSIHVAESPAESELTLAGRGPFAEMFARRGILWQAPGTTPTRYVWDQGVLGPLTLAVHCVHQSMEDIALTASSGAAIVHCPKSNAKLGAGIAPLAGWLARGDIRIALGTDSAVSNNTLDLFEEMRFGLLAQRAALEQVQGVSALDMVRMATLGGAQALGLSHKIGSLAPGKQADLIGVRLDSPHMQPAHDPYSALVYCGRASDVCLSVVDGRILYETGQWRTLDAAAICRDAARMRARLPLTIPET